MRRLLLALLLPLLTAQTLSGSGAPTVGGAPAASSVVASISCTSFDVSGTDGQTLNIDYGDGVYCTAEASTVSGTAIRVNNYVTKVWTEWNWDTDGEFSDFTAAGRTYSLNVSEGTFAGNIYYPTVWGETCNGGSDNTIRTITATVYAVVAGVRVSDSTTMTLCIRNPTAAYDTSHRFAYCDDSDCTNDAGVPAGFAHGGNLTDLATILDKCDASGPSWILLEGGVTFTTASSTVNVNSSCMIESYGTGKAIWNITDVGGTLDRIIMLNATCVEYRVRNIELKGGGYVISPASFPQTLFATVADANGCLSVAGIVADTAGQEMAGLFSSGQDAHDIFLQDIQWLESSHVGAGDYFFYGSHERAVLRGVNVQESGEMLVRWHNVRGGVVDAFEFGTVRTGSNTMAIRQDCNSASPPCTGELYSGQVTVSRGFVLSANGSARPFELNDDGSGALTEPTQVRDVEFLDILFAQTSSTSAPRSPTFSDVCAYNGGEAMQRITYMRNVVEAFGFDSTSSRLLEHVSNTGCTVENIEFVGNILSGPGDTNTLNFYGQNPTGLSADNNACFENGTGNCNMFTGFAEPASNVESEGTDPFDGTVGAPGTLSSVLWTDFKVTSSSPLCAAAVGVTPWPTDFEGTSIPASGALYCAGIDYAP